MTNPQILTAHFTDANHDLNVQIENNIENWDELSMTIDGIKFYSDYIDGFGWWRVEGEQAEEACSKFHMVEYDLSYIETGGNRMVREFALQCYAMDIKIPITLIHSDSQTDKEGVLEFAFQHIPYDGRSKTTFVCDGKSFHVDDIICTKFSVSVDDETFAADNPSIDFEKSLLNICKAIKGKYLLKCCFGCKYADYGANIRCFEQVGARYEQIESKVSFFNILADAKKTGINIPAVCETWLCEKFRPRIGGKGGYRGNIY